LKTCWGTWPNLEYISGKCATKTQIKSYSST